MTSQLYSQPVDRDLTTSLSKSFLTALTLLRDPIRAEALVIEAVESLDPGDITANSIRDVVIDHLVQAQIANMSHSPASRWGNAGTHD